MKWSFFRITADAVYQQFKNTLWLNGRLFHPARCIDFINIIMSFQNKKNKEKRKKLRLVWAAAALYVPPVFSQRTRAYGADPPPVLPQGDTWVTRIFIDVAKLY